MGMKTENLIFVYDLEFKKVTVKTFITFLGLKVPVRQSYIKQACVLKLVFAVLPLAVRRAHIIYFCISPFSGRAVTIFTPCGFRVLFFYLNVRIRLLFDFSDIGFCFHAGIVCYRICNICVAFCLLKKSICQVYC